MIQIDNIDKTYQVGNTPVIALRGITLRVESGEFLAISGPSGSGKTTLLNIMGCIEMPTTGKVFHQNVDITTLGPDALADLRADRIGFVFQNYNLLPVLTAKENVEYALGLRPSISRSERERRVMESLSEVGLERFADHKPRELSGGQRQRVAIARALVKKPEFVLADEPTANLDHRTGSEIIQVMKTISQTHGTTFIFSTHDPKVMDAASRIVRLVDGQMERGA